MPLLIRITTVPISFKTLLKGQMQFMKHKGYDVLMISANGAEVQEIEEHELCEHIAVPLTRTINPLNDLRCLLKLIQIFRKYRPDIVHTHTPKAGLLGLIAAYFCSVPVKMHTIAGIPWVNYKGFLKILMVQLEKLNSILADALYPNSEKLLRMLEVHGIATAKMKVIASGTSNGIDTKWYNKNSEGVQLTAKQLLGLCNVQDDARVWVFIGRLVKDKGIEDLVNAFLLLKEEFQNDQLWLVGEEEPDLDKISINIQNQIATNSAIKKWGFQNDVRPFLAASNLLVFPSYREGFPNVPLQAASMECPMILTDINGCNEIIENGVSGLLVPVANHLALLGAMFKLRNNTELQEYFALNALKSVKQKFEQKILWEEIHKEYIFHLANSKQYSLANANF